MQRALDGAQGTLFTAAVYVREQIGVSSHRSNAVTAAILMPLSNTYFLPQQYRHSLSATCRPLPCYPILAFQQVVAHECYPLLVQEFVPDYAT